MFLDLLIRTEQKLETAKREIQVARYKRELAKFEERFEDAKRFQETVELYTAQVSQLEKKLKRGGNKHA